MELAFTILNIGIAFYCAFTAGKFKALIDINKVDKRETPKNIYVWMWINTVLSLYFIVSIYGYGIRLGTL